MEEMTNYQSLQELFVDKETQELIKKWKMSNEKQKKEVFKSTLSDAEYQKLAPIFKTLKEETENYAPYYKAFKALCKFCHIVPNGTIITKYELKKGKKEDDSIILVEYTYNAKPITLPAGTKLYHQSVVAGIKELIPKWKLRGKSENGYLCEAPRIYLTMSKSLPTISTDNKFMSKMHTYEVLRQSTKVYIDPLLPDVFQKAVYVETVTPIPVKEIEKESLVKKASDAVKKTVLK